MLKSELIRRLQAIPGDLEVCISHYAEEAFVEKVEVVSFSKDDSNDVGRLAHIGLPCDQDATVVMLSLSGIYPPTSGGRFEMGENEYKNTDAAQVGIDLKITSLHEAIERVNAIRERRSGVAGIYLYLGHGGDNTCRLRDSDGRVLGGGDSGESLLEAVKRAERDYNVRCFCRLDQSVMADYCDRASALCGLHASKVFTTAGMQAVVFDAVSFTPTAEEVVEALTKFDGVVRLKEGDAWMLLPAGFKRA